MGIILMTWDEFYIEITKTFSYMPSFKYTSNWTVKDNPDWHGTPDAYEVEWQTGGMAGGNCWGEDENYPLDAEPVPDLDLLDEFLEKICPTMSIFVYKRLIKDIVEQTSRHESEYYGNYTTYGIKRVNFRNLYDFLVKEGLLSTASTSINHST
jgi:hypothetical protein